ncbi:MAG TPA: type II secretion system F family protein, partial [Symbiobacteriaceae bacterium]|nr:type II secretion system F family protein [Symbiobacteriaceae bacterium]
IGTAAVAYYQTKRKRSLRDIVGGGDSGVDQEATPRDRPESFMDRWERAAMQAGLEWKRNVYYTVAGAGLLVSLGLALSGHTNGALLVALAALAGPSVYVNRLKAQRAARFAAQLPQALFLAASVLRAGGTLLQAVDSIAAETESPMKEEFQRIQQQMRLQVPAHEAMAQTHARIGVREFAAVVVAARITAEVGGNLAHIYDQVARSIVEAQNAQRAVKSFTTEGRMSANMIAALPFLVMGLLHFLSPGYFEPLFTTWPGRLVLAGCVGTIALGWFTIRRMVDIRVF